MLGIELRIAITELVVIDSLLKLLDTSHQIDHSHSESLTNKEIKNIKNFILESDMSISDKDIEVIYEEY